MLQHTAFEFMKAIWSIFYPRFCWTYLWMWLAVSTCLWLYLVLLLQPLRQPQEWYDIEYESDVFTNTQGSLQEITANHLMKYNGTHGSVRSDCRNLLSSTYSYMSVLSSIFISEDRRSRGSIHHFSPAVPVRSPLSLSSIYIRTKNLQYFCHVMRHNCLEKRYNSRVFIGDEEQSKTKDNAVEQHHRLCENESLQGCNEQRITELDEAGESMQCDQPQNEDGWKQASKANKE